MNFVISLNTAIDRRKHIKNEFEKYNINYKFFDAVNKATLQDYQNKFGIIFNDEKFMSSEKACFLSHVALWDYCVSHNLEYIAVFEDDIYLSVNAKKLLNNFNRIPRGLDLIKLEKFEDAVLMSFKKINIQDEFVLRLLKCKHLGTAGYILSNKAARLLINQVRGSIQENPIDELIFNLNIQNNFLSVHQLVPSLVMQADKLGVGKLCSQIQLERANRVTSIKKIKKNFSYKIKNEYIRVMKQFKMIFCKIQFDLGDK